MKRGFVLMLFRFKAFDKKGYFNANLARVNVRKRFGSDHCWCAMIETIFAHFLWWELRKRNE